MIEKIAGNIATLVSSSLSLDEDNREVLAYGAFFIIQIIWTISLVTIFGLIFGVKYLSLIILISGSALRKYSGGVHATAPNRCAIIGVIMSVGLSLIIQNYRIVFNIELCILFALFSFMFTYYCIFKYCPIDTPNKPIVKDDDKNRLKKSSLKVVNILVVLVILLLLVYTVRENYLVLFIVAGISGGLFNQALSLTPFGFYIISSIDKILAYLV